MQVRTLPYTCANCREAEANVAIPGWWGPQRWFCPDCSKGELGVVIGGQLPGGAISILPRPADAGTVIIKRRTKKPTKRKRKS